MNGLSRLWPILLLSSVTPGMAVAQSADRAVGTLSGSVRSVRGQPLEAAQVSVAGTGIGALTNRAGRFLLLDVPAGDIELSVILLGFREESLTMTLPAAGAADVEVILVAAPILLDEVVVTGTGVATERRRLGNTVAVIATDELTDAPISNFSELIQGREAGLTALTSDGAVGSGTRIRIRGSNSISMLNEPLVYVDGIRVDNSGDMGGSGRGGDLGSPLDDLDPRSIERVEVLKGAAAATLYGSEASSGVIQVFTKQGVAGRTTVTVDVDYGRSELPDRFGPQAGFARDAESAAILGELYGLPIEPFSVFERNFVPDLLETGDDLQVGTSVSGGSDGVQYFISGRFVDQDGTLGGQSLGNARDGLLRGQGQASLGIAVTPALRLRLATSYGVSRLESFARNNSVDGPLFAAWAAKPERGSCGPSGIDPESPIGDDTPDCVGGGNPWGASGFGTPRELLQREVAQERQHFTGSLTGSWAISDAFSAQLIVGLDQVDERAEGLLPYGWRVDGVAVFSPVDGGALRRTTRSHSESTVDARLSWATPLGSDFEVSATAGAQGYLSDSRSEQIDAFNFPAPGVTDLGLAEGQNAIDSQRSERGAGGFGQAQLGYRGWLFATLGLRYDRSSAFGIEASGELYPKAGLSVVLSDLDAWSVGWLPTLRLRGAIGQSGLQPGTFDRLTTYEPRQGASGPAIVPGNPGNPDLRPERATELELGLEAELLDGVVGFGVTWWDRATTDALVSRPYPTAGGFVEPQLANIGRLDASGVEIDVNGAISTGSSVAVRWFANAAYLRERVTDLGGVAPISASGSYVRHRNQIVEGYAPGAYFGARIIPRCQGADSGACYTPGATVPYDVDGDGAPDATDAFMTYLQSRDAVPVGDLNPLLDDADGDGDLYDHYLGKPAADWQGSFGAEITLWNSLSLGSLFEYRTGEFYASNLTSAFRNAAFRNSRSIAEVESALLDPATRTDGEARLDAALRWAEELVSLNPYSGVNLIERADMLRWRELSVTYRPPMSLVGWSGASSVAITLTGRNLAVWTPYSGVDPEANEMSRCGGDGEAPNSVQCNFLEGTAMFTLPLPRRFGIGLHMTF